MTASLLSRHDGDLLFQHGAGGTVVDMSRRRSSQLDHNEDGPCCTHKKSGINYDVALM